mgnify:CR=1 FL=1
MRRRWPSGLGLGSRVNTILQTCFFALSGVMPRDEAIAAIKQETERTYARKGKEVVKRNFAAIDSALENLHRGQHPGGSRWAPGTPAPRTRLGTGLRARRHRRDPRAPRRRAAGERAAGRRDVSDRHDTL